MMNAGPRRAAQAHHAALPDRRPVPDCCPTIRRSTRAMTTRPASSPVRARSISAWRPRPPSGLIVPVIRHAESRDLWDIAAEVAPARRGHPRRQGDARGAVAARPSPSPASGPLGGIASTPVINRPEVAIIAVNKVKRDAGGRRRPDRDPQDDEPVAVLRPPRRRRLGRGRVHAGLKGLIENPLKLLSMR